MTEKEINYESLPFHELRSLCKSQGIEYKRHDKKDDLIAMLKLGKTIHKPQVKREAPRLEPKPQVKMKSFLPQEIRPELEAMAAQGLTWDINEESNSVSFDRQGGIRITCTLDQSARNILMAAKQTRAGKAPIEKGRNDR